MSELSSRDMAAYEYIREKASEGITPSIREICAAVGIKSTSSVHRIVQRLMEAGLIERRGENLNRSIRLARDSSSNIKVPVLGTVTAGLPITAIEDIEGYINFSTSKHYDGKLFGLKVRGESMIKAAILDGDTIIAEQTSTAENGDIVIAMVDGTDATVKRYYKENGHYRLQPENDEMDPMIFDEVTIIGRVVAVLRYL